MSDLYTCTAQSSLLISLKDLVHDVLQQIPSAILIFLASLGRVLHASASRILFRQLRLLDAAQIFNGTTLSILSPLISNPKRYGPAVKTIIIEDPIVIETIPAPADARSLHRLFQACPNLEEFVWEASLPPPDGLCEVGLYFPCSFCLDAHIPFVDACATMQATQSFFKPSF